MAELDYLTEKRLLSNIEDSSKRFSYQAGVLTSEILKNKYKDQGLLLKKFDEDKQLLATIRDRFHSNSSYWLSIQQSIDTIDILIRKLR